MDAADVDETEDTPAMVVRPGMVIQLAPERCEWGPLLCVVREVKGWGVKCYAILPMERGEATASMHMRVNHGAYACIGPAAWVQTADVEEVH